MSSCLPLQHQRYGGPKIVELARRRAIPFQFEMMLGRRHLFLRLRSARTLFRFAGELRGAFRNDDSWQHARCPNVDSAPQINRLVQ